VYSLRRQICRHVASKDWPRERGSEEEIMQELGSSFRTPRRSLFGLTAGLLGIAALGARAQNINWKPSRPINLIVPWSAGGATDQVTRLAALELEKPLGQTIVIVNQPGASGAIGTNSCLAAARDGYTWASGASVNIGSFETLGTSKARITDWNLFISVGNVWVLSVAANSPYKTAKDVLAAMSARPNSVSCASASATSGMDQIAKATGLTYRRVKYDGGAPAVIATVAGETEVTTQLASEQVEMIRAKKLIPLAAIYDKPLPLEGYGVIPPLSDTIPGFKATAATFGIFIPKGVPDEVIATMNRIWTTIIANSEAMKKYATSHGALLMPVCGEEAQRLVWPEVQFDAWMLYNTGQAKVRPDTVGIPAL
jgi:tripartite-type tricarboxylate transporter receptor subunit TctC